MFEKMMPGKKCPLIISNMDRSDEGGTHEYFGHFAKELAVTF